MRLLITTTLLLIPMLVFAAPGVPHQIHGSVSGFTSGTVSVLVAGSTVASATITEDGTFGKSGNLLFVSDPDGVYAGETITFKINDSSTSNSLVFENGGLSEVALSVSSVGTGSSGGGSGASTLVSPENTLLGDFNRDGVVDIQDYNYLIVRWGTPDADLNDDGTTNILDFNILMAHWS